MLEFLRGRASDRKLRLFAAACCRRLWTVVDSDCRRLCVLTEGYADGQVDQAELLAARDEAHDSDWTAGLAFEEAAALDDIETAAGDAAGNAAHAAADAATDYPAFRERTPAWAAARQAEFASQATLLRELFGNPFRPYPVPATWPALVVDLAQQLYDGADVRLVLHDALLDAGHAELSEHFRVEEWHPKGCWILDLVLGRK